VGEEWRISNVKGDAAGTGLLNGNGRITRREALSLASRAITLGRCGDLDFHYVRAVGNAVAAGISNLYYPAADRSLGKTVNKWGQPDQPRYNLQH
jgi:hypothetical protein